MRIAALLFLFAFHAQAEEAAPAPKSEPRLLMDKTGLHWVAPFDQALKVAKESRRLLLVKPIAFGTGKSGCW